LPNPSLITEPAKTAEMICISSKGFCGEDDCGYPRLKKARLPAGKAGSHQVEKSRYVLDMGRFYTAISIRQ
jgi:hypothetical protein